jgi:hypothetical protein
LIPFAQRGRTINFDSNPRVAERMLAHLKSRQPHTFHLSAAVVEGVIRSTLLAAEETSEDNARALSVLHRVEHESDSREGAQAETKNP